MKKKLSFVDKMTLLLTILALLLAGFAILLANGFIQIGQSGFFLNF